MYRNNYGQKKCPHMKRTVIMLLRVMVAICASIRSSTSLHARCTQPFNQETSVFVPQGANKKLAGHVQLPMVTTDSSMNDYSYASAVKTKG